MSLHTLSFIVCKRPWYGRRGKPMGFTLHFVGGGVTQIDKTDASEAEIKAMAEDWLALSAGAKPGTYELEIIDDMPLFLPERDDWDDHLGDVIQVLAGRAVKAKGQALHAAGRASGYMQAIALLSGLQYEYIEQRLFGKEE